MYKIVRGRHAPVKGERAQQLRRDMTRTEARLWQHLRANRLGNLHFRRQQVIDGFIADFYCHSAGLVVEVDGGVHEDRGGYDAERDAILAGRGLRILRFPGGRVESDIKGVLNEVRVAAQSRRTA